MLSILLAVGAAFASAVNAVTQHVASTAAPGRAKGWRLARYLVRNPLWLFGVGAMVTGFLLQAVALHEGRESVVQSVLVSELVFSLVVGRVWLRRTVEAAAWASAALAAAGLGVFLAMSEPKGGHPYATSAAWLPALLTCGVLVAGFALAARNPSPTRRAAFYACAAGITGAVFATFLKSATDTLVRHGVAVALRQGPLFGLIAVGSVGAIFTQAAFHYGPLALSQPLMLIVNPVVSIALGIWVYGEHFEGYWPRIAVGVLGFAAMSVGVVLLARTAPSLAAGPVKT